jgi:hypothetical protein
MALPGMHRLMIPHFSKIGLDFLRFCPDYFGTHSQRTKGMAAPEASSRIFGGRPSATAETWRAAKPSPPAGSVLTCSGGKPKQARAIRGTQAAFPSRCPRERDETEGFT